MQRRQRQPGLVSIVVVLLLSMTAMTPAAMAQRPRQSGQPVNPPRNQLVFEGGFVSPLGDLKDDYFDSDKGLNAENGYELGARFRHFLNPYLAVSPSFQYVKFGEYSDVADFDGYGENLGFQINTSIYRYAFELQSFLSPVRSQMRMYFTLGISLNNNRYEDLLEGYYPYKHNTLSLGAAAGVGLTFGPIELSGVYNYNRFETDGLPTVSGTSIHNWDYFALRVGLAFGRF